MKVLSFGMILLLNFSCVGSKKANEEVDISSNKNPHDWLGYRLGDMIQYKEWRDKTDGKEFHIRKFPNSIASEYMRRTDDESNYDILLDIVKNRTQKSEQIPSKDMLVIHLRIGDVIDDMPQTAAEFLSHEVKYSNGHNYVKPLSYYQKIIDKIKPLSLSSISLIGGFHKTTSGSRKSLEYVAGVRNFFEKNGFKVTERINFNPDDDFIFMSNALYFTPSGGGFSRIIKTMVEKQNHTIIAP